MRDPDVVVVGAGAAGLAAAVKLRASGVGKIVVYDRNDGPGGILPQCIHAGFGLHYYGRELTGPEYAERLWSTVHRHDIEVVFNASVASIDRDRSTTVVLPDGCRQTARPRAVVVATGCRERTRENLEIAGTRPAGVLTAGLAQTLVNRMGLRIGSTVVIQGSGDIGMIMARRMSIEGYRVVAVLERLPYLGGTLRNKIQCLDAFRIPLWLSTDIVDIEGERRVQGVKVRRRGDDAADEIRHLDCDTVLIASGLIAETRLIDESGIGPGKDNPRGGGIFTCGNANIIHDLADFASTEGESAAVAAAAYIRGGAGAGAAAVQAASNGADGRRRRFDAAFFARTEGRGICTVCPKGCVMSARSTDCAAAHGLSEGERTGLEQYYTTAVWRKEGGDLRRQALRSTRKIPVGQFAEVRAALQRLGSPIDSELRVEIPSGNGSLAKGQSSVGFRSSIVF